MKENIKITIKKIIIINPPVFLNHTLHIKIQGIIITTDKRKKESHIKAATIIIKHPEESNLQERGQLTKELNSKEVVEGQGTIQIATIQEYITMRDLKRIGLTIKRGLIIERLAAVGINIISPEITFDLVKNKNMCKFIFRVFSLWL